MPAHLDAGFIADLNRWLTQKTTPPPPGDLIGGLPHPGAPGSSFLGRQRRWLATLTGCAIGNTAFQGPLPLISPLLHPQRAVPSPISHPRPPRGAGHSRRGTRSQGLKRKHVPAMLTAAKAGNSTLMDAWVSKTRPLHTSFSLRRKDVLTPATVWTNPEATMLSKISQHERTNAAGSVWHLERSTQRHTVEAGVPALSAFPGDRV